MLLQAPQRELRSWSTDSRRWAHYKPRPGDVVIATSAKCGTTWMQQIVSLLLSGSPEPRSLQDASPWIDHRFAPIEAVTANIEAQTERRFLKSHLPFDAMPIYDEVQYIHVARYGLDAFMSWHNHTLNYNPMPVEISNRVGMEDETIGRPLPRPDPSPHAHFRAWMIEGPDARLADDFPAARYFDTERSWWQARKRPNVLMVHYNDLKVDLAGEMRRIADYLGISLQEDVLLELADAAQFDSMRKNGAMLMPRAGMAWDKGHERFLNRGTNERWREALTEDDVAQFTAREKKELSPALAGWLAHGRLAAGDPRTAPD